MGGQENGSAIINKIKIKNNPNVSCLKIQIRLIQISSPHPVESSMPSPRCLYFLSTTTFLWSLLVLELALFIHSHLQCQWPSSNPEVKLAFHYLLTCTHFKSYQVFVDILRKMEWEFTLQQCQLKPNIKQQVMLQRPSVISQQLQFPFLYIIKPSQHLPSLHLPFPPHPA